MNSSAWSRWLLASCLFVTLIVAAFLAGMAAGFGLGRLTAPAVAAVPIAVAVETPDDAPRPTQPPAPTRIPTATPVPTRRPPAQPTPARTPTGAELPIFAEAIEQLHNSFYGDVPAGQELEYAAIRGVVASLDDRFTSFMTPAEAERFGETLDGSFEGIGAQVDENSGGGARIIEIYPGFPADKAGLRRNDVIIAVDGQDVMQRSLSEIITLVRGPEGSNVILTIRRADVTEPLDILVTRARIEMPVVEAKMLPENIAYVKLQEFSRIAPERLQAALSDLLQQQPAGLVLDLRGNPGGLLDVAVQVGSQFLAEGDILIERRKDGSEERYRTTGNGLATGIPLAVLVDAGSASASEIVAGAIQDAGRGPLIGTKTFGKGSVQLTHTLSDGSLLRVTIARWFTPLGRGIHGSGLEPDQTVERSEEDRNAGRDPQLDAAVAHLLGR